MIRGPGLPGGVCGFVVKTRLGNRGTMKKTVDLDTLIEMVGKGATVKTGMDVFNKNGVLLLDRSVPIDEVGPLELLKEKGILELSISSEGDGGIWDQRGDVLDFKKKTDASSDYSSLTGRLREIAELKMEATEKYQLAKANIKKVLAEIRESGGEFDFPLVEETVTDLLGFISKNENGFSYLTKSIFEYDDYLYNHAVNVCTMGTAVLNKFNHHFSKTVDTHLNASAMGVFDEGESDEEGFIYYYPRDIIDMSIGYFLHDVGKVMLPDNVLNKNGKLTQKEFELVKRHSYEKGMEVLDRNRINNPLIYNCVKYHHAPLHLEDGRGYPDNVPPGELPAFVKICKLVDIYDAMTSKRSYKEAFNPIQVVTDIFRTYAKKDPMLQYIMHSFVKSIGIYPPGSVVTVRSGQAAYVLDSTGPLVVMLTDESGNLIEKPTSPVQLQKQGDMAVDNRKPLKSPAEAYELLPAYLKI